MNTKLPKYLIVLIFPFCFIACENEDEGQITYEDIELAVTGSRHVTTIDIPVSGVSEDWHIYSPTADLWLTFERIKGEAKLIVSVNDNETPEVRESYIIIKNRGQSQRINVSQDRYRTIELSLPQLLMRYVRFSRDVTFSAEGFGPVSVSVKDEDKGWLSTSVNNETGIITVTTEQNDSPQDRESIITVSATELFTQIEKSVELTVRQSRGGIIPYYFDIPDFSESQVYKVMDGDKQVAQITKEFLREKGLIIAQAVVVYPVKEDKVEFERGGYVTQILKQNSDLTDETQNFTQPSEAVHGGQIVFDRDLKKITSYIQGTVENPVTTVYMPGDIEMGDEEVEGSVKATVVPDLIEDVRADETNSYPIVKIGMQYWMAKNLNTIYYNEGKNYEAIPTNFANSEIDDFAFCCVFGFPDVNDTSTDALRNRERYGVLYSFLTVGGYASFEESGLTNGGVQANDYLSPDGWIAPTADDFRELVDYVGETLRLREFINYETGEQIFMNAGRETDEGISGFAGRNSSYRATNGTWTAMGNANGCWTWSRSYNSNTNAYLLNMGSLQSGQALRRAASIRSIKIDY
jgi:uncharacterized protein (TIGR02145 family)